MNKVLKKCVVWLLLGVLLINPIGSGGLVLANASLQEQVSIESSPNIEEEGVKPTVKPSVEPSAAPSAAPKDKAVTPTVNPTEPPMLPPVMKNPSMARGLMMPATVSVSEFITEGDAIVGITATGRAQLIADGGVLEIPALPGIKVIKSLEGIPVQTITALTIVEGYEEIGDSVFSNQRIASLTLPSTLKSIGNNAFQNQDNQLTALSLPSGLTTLGASAFATNQLTSIDLSSTALTTLANDVFRDNAITSINLPAAMTEIGERAFMNNAIGPNLTLNNIKKIDTKAFANNNIVTASLPIIENIAGDAFAGNGPEGLSGQVVNITANTETTATSEFSNGSGHIVNPVSITIKYVDQETSASVKSEDVFGANFRTNNLYQAGATMDIDAPAVTGYTPVVPSKSVKITADMEVTFEYINTAKEPSITVPPSVQQFFVNDYVSAAELLAGVTAKSNVDGSAIASANINVMPVSESFPLSTGATGEHKVIYTATDSFGNVVNKEVTIVIRNTADQDYIGNSHWQYADFDIQEVGGKTTIVGLTAAGKIKYNDAMFSDASRPLTLPDRDIVTGKAVQVIGVNAFNPAGYDTYTGVDFSYCKSTIEAIGESAFRNSQLTELDLGGCNSLGVIGSAAFYSSPLISLDLSGCSSLEMLYGSCFERAQLTELDLNDCISLKRIWGSVFRDSPLTKLNINNCKNLEYLDERVFQGALLTELDLSNLSKLWTIKIDAFLSSPLTKINFSGCESLIEIRGAAFYKAKLTSLDLSDCIKLEEIDHSVFKDSPLTELNLSGCSSLKYIRANAFKIAKLTELDLRDCSELTSIGEAAFEESLLTELDLSGCGELTVIGSDAFSKSQLTELDLSMCNKLEQIGDRAFAASPLTELNLSNCSVLTNIGYSSFESAQLTELDLSDCSKLVTIAGRAFWSSPLTEIDLSGCSSLKTIGIYAFEYAQLTQLDLSSCVSLEVIDTAAFRYSPLTELNLSNCSSLRILNSGSFGYAQLTELDFSDCVKLERVNATFSGSPLVKIDFSNCSSLKTIEQGSFENALLTELDLSDCVALEGIGRYAFRFSPITDLNFSGCVNLKSIGYAAFRDAKLKKVDLSDCLNLESIYRNAFHESSELEYILIGGVSTNNTTGSIYYNSTEGVGSGITRYNFDIPLYILDNSANIQNDIGYVVNPVWITVNHYATGTTEKIYPSTETYLEGAPFDNKNIDAPSIFGYSVNGAATKQVSVTLDELKQAILGGGMITKSVDFYYDVNPLDVENSDVTLIHNPGILHDVIGEALQTQIEITTNGVNIPNPNGMVVEITYDPRYIDQNSIQITQHPLFTTDTSTPGVVKITLKDHAPGAAVDLKVGIFWHLKPGMTQEGTQYPTSAVIYTASDGQGGGHDALCYPKDQPLSGYYRRPKITLLANGETRDGEKIYGGKYDSQTGKFIETPVIEYASGVMGLERNISEITYTIPLPEYEFVGMQEGDQLWIAEFDPLKNPLWTISSDGKSVSCTVTGLNTTAPKMPALYLDFPNIVVDSSVKAKVDFVAKQFNPSEYETTHPFTGSDTITNIISGDPEGPVGELFSKTRLLPEYFFEALSDKSKEFSWRLNVSTKPIPSGGYLGDLIVYDDRLDDRMYYTGVDMGSLAGATLRAYNSLDEEIFNVTKAKGRINFPSTTLGTVTSNDIVRIEIDATMLKIRQSSSAQAIIYAKIKDPINITYAACQAQGKAGLLFENFGGTTQGVYYNRDGTEDSRFGYSEMESAYEIKGKSIEVELYKNILNKKSLPFFHDDTVIYDIGIHNKSGVNPLEPKYPVAMPSGLIVENFEVYDVLPKGMIGVKYEPSNALVEGAVNLDWNIIGDVVIDGEKHTILHVRADKVNLNNVTSLGKFYATFDVTLRSVQPILLDNLVYAYFEENAGEYVLDLDDSQETATNPLGISGAIKANKEIRVSTAQASVSKKYIHEDVSGTGTQWGPWVEDVKTLPGTLIQYRLLHMNGSKERKNGVYIDVFPYFGDTTTTNTPRSLRGSDFANTFVDAKVEANSEVNPSDYTISYLVSSTPIDLGTQSADDYFAAAIWTPEASLSPGDMTNVRAMKVEAKSGVELPVNAYLEIIVTMKSPTDNDLEGKRGVNTFIRKDDEHVNFIEVAPVQNEIYKKAEIILNKKDEKTGAQEGPLAQAEFGLYNASGTGLLKVATSGVDGRVVFSDIMVDDYIIKEHKAPEGYQLLTTPLEVKRGDFSDRDNSTNPITIKDKFTATLNVKNELTPKYGQLVIDKQDYQGNPLGGVKFKVSRIVNNAVVDTYNGTTDAKGKILFSNLPVSLGTNDYYTIDETAAPNRLQALTGVQIKVNESDITLKYNPMKDELVEVQGAANTVVLKNVYAALEILKLGVTSTDRYEVPEWQFRTSYGVPISGVYLRVYECDDKGQIGNPVEAVARATNASGKIDLNSIEAGKIYVVKEEVPPSGWPANWTWDVATDVYFTVNEVGIVQQVFLNDAGTDIDHTKTNNFVTGMVVVKDLPIPGKGKIVINKKDNSGNALKGAIFQLDKQAADGTWIDMGQWTSPDGGVITIMKDENGKDIATGSYRISEVKAPDGYLKSSRIEYFTVKDGNLALQEFEFDYVNIRIDTFVIKGDHIETFNLNDAAQVDAFQKAKDWWTTNHPELNVQEVKQKGNVTSLVAGLEGAEFEVKEYIGMSTSGILAETYTVTSGADGLLDLAGADPVALLFKSGYTYTFRETKAPSGYELVEGLFTYQPDNEYSTLLADKGFWIPINNRVSSRKIIVSKYGMDTGAGLAGAEYTLFNPDGTIAKDRSGNNYVMTSNSHGFIEFLDVATPGTYYIKETAAPADYQLDEHYYKVRITGQNDIGRSAAGQDTDNIAQIPNVQIVDWGTTNANKTVALYDLTENDPFDLTLEKEVVGKTDPTTDSFDFVVEVEENGAYELYALKPYIFFEDATDPGSNRVTGADGIITLKHGEKATIPSLSDNQEFRITEQDMLGYEASSSFNGGAVVDGSVVEETITGNDKLVFTNKYTKLSAVKEVDKVKAEVGDILTYTIKVTNESTLAVNNVKIKDAAPEMTTLVAGSASDGGVESAPRVEWLIPSIAGRETKEVTFRVEVLDEARGKEIPNIAVYGDDDEETNDVETEVLMPTPTATPTPTPTPSATPSVTPTPSATPTATPTPSATPTATPTATPNVTPTAIPTATPIPSATSKPGIRTSSGNGTSGTNTTKLSTTAAKTGDINNMILWFALFAGSAILVGGTMFTSQRKRKKK